MGSSRSRASRSPAVTAFISGRAPFRNTIDPAKPPLPSPLNHPMITWAEMTSGRIQPFPQPSPSAVSMAAIGATPPLPVAPAKVSSPCFADLHHHDLPSSAQPAAAFGRPEWRPDLPHWRSTMPGSRTEINAIYGDSGRALPTLHGRGRGSTRGGVASLLHLLGDVGILTRCQILSRGGNCKFALLSVLCDPLQPRLRKFSIGKALRDDYDLCEIVIRRSLSMTDTDLMPRFSTAV